MAAALPLRPLLPRFFSSLSHLSRVPAGGCGYNMIRGRLAGGGGVSPVIGLNISQLAKRWSNSSHDSGMGVGFELSPSVGFPIGSPVGVVFVLLVSSSFFLPSNPISSF
ncbi:hypothetical protein HanRHA438_Chr16g0761871 [Helianthus annuus]|nr:hypothetical protein HanOQP8_Chr16g0617891 [Helianthus annuus]KAJ0821338.1 hypothetical protein HanPSC8_Chr16g0718951 [Helianthus annuus]KAJ0836003.1 hypothetical protein HanRHA438_Chr16g0761871 [Helianthus annuus]